MNKLTAEDISVDNTIDAQMEVEQEDSASLTLLNELVRNETKKHTHELTSQIESLKHTIKSLKSTRDHNPTPGTLTKRNATTKATQQNTSAKSAATPEKYSSKIEDRSSQRNFQRIQQKRRSKSPQQREISDGDNPSSH